MLFLDIRSGYFFGHICTPAAVTKIVASEYEDVFLLQTENEDFKRGSFGDDALHVMKRHEVNLG
jgi:hypothetical protein